MSRNKLIIAAAGSGKTSYLVKEALKIKTCNVLITTFTDANEAEIKRKIATLNNGSIPSNITIQTWFSFLLQHGVRPYQGGVFDKKVKGLILVSGQSSPYTIESDIENHYFSKSHKIYSDKLSKFILKCDEKSAGQVTKRISRIFPHIYIDEVQDLSGWDLNFLKCLFRSESKILLVGDPRQAVYSTNNSNKNKKFKKSNIVNFFDDPDIQGDLEVDSESLIKNYRSNQQICAFSNTLFPDYNCTKSGQNEITGHDGVFFVKEIDIDDYLKKYPDCVQLRDSVKEKRTKINYCIMNFGVSKGLDFNRVLIYPTGPILGWIKNHNSGLAPTSRCKFYVALTRAKYSVGIVCNFNNSDNVEGIIKFNFT